MQSFAPHPSKNRQKNRIFEEHFPHFQGTECDFFRQRSICGGCAKGVLLMGWGRAGGTERGRHPAAAAMHRQKLQGMRTIQNII